MTPAEQERLFESFLVAYSPATHELASLGEQAIPILEALFSGSARNAYGHPYLRIGALDRALVTAKLLGPTARPLERYLREALAQKCLYAAEALGALGALEENSILELVRTVEAVDIPPADWTLAFESAAALLRSNAGSHPAVTRLAAGNGKAATVLRQAIAGTAGPRSMR